MNMSKMLLTGVFITVMAVGYVHQQVEIVKAGYTLQKNDRELSTLIDQNSALMYNLSQMESPRYLLASLDPEEVRFASRRTSHYGGTQLAYAGTEREYGSNTVLGRMMDLLAPYAEAKSRE
ncbi:MAG: hypothetical protein PHH49_03560 [Candidatus Omnitrophica bacterium]|nr:hypothetical protein [Candidatus Omnitrophota bacterium]MDD5488026.1 hypothetical protein [Candidatus Omnitrophota bacterium]